MRFRNKKHDVALFFTHNPISCWFATLLAAKTARSCKLAFLDYNYDDSVLEKAENNLDQRQFDKLYTNPKGFKWIKPFLWLKWLSGGRIEIYHTSSNGISSKFLQKRLPPHHLYIYEHGLTEMFHFIEACEQGKTCANQTYLHIFYDEIMAYMQRHHIPSAIQSKPFNLPEENWVLSEKSRNRSLFLLSPLLEDEVFDKNVVESSLVGFLERRPSTWHYMILDHYRPTEKTRQLVCHVMDRFGLTYEILPSTRELPELVFPRYECAEISGFYSAAIFYAHKIYGVPFDTTLPELAPYLATPPQ